MEKAALGEPCRVADLIDRSGGVALGQHQVFGGIEQLLPGRRVDSSRFHVAYLPVGMMLRGADDAGNGSVPRWSGHPAGPPVRSNLSTKMMFEASSQR